jgi:hypothetical protein
MRRDPIMVGMDQEPPCKTPVLCNKYALEENEQRMRGDNKRGSHTRSQSMPRHSRYGDRLMPPGQDNGQANYDDNEMEMQPIRKGRKRERSGMFVPYVCSMFSSY